MEILTGILVSLVIEAKKHYGQKLNSFETLASVFFLSLFTAIVVASLKQVGYWESVLNILLVAGGTHNIIFRQLQSKR